MHHRDTTVPFAIQFAPAAHNLIACGLIVAMAGGCSDSIVAARGKVVPAVGTLIYRNQPVADAQLTFLGDDASEPAFAVTDAQGRFQCMTNDSSEGLRPGNYCVVVSRPHGGIPDRYAAAGSSPLHVTVKEGVDNELSLELED